MVKNAEIKTLIKHKKEPILRGQVLKRAIESEWFLSLHLNNDHLGFVAAARSKDPRSFKTLDSIYRYLRSFNIPFEMFLEEQPK